jgi:hypothetical protein
VRWTPTPGKVFLRVTDTEWNVFPLDVSDVVPPVMVYPPAAQTSRRGYGAH